MEVKRKIFRSLAAVSGEHTILATNTSYLDVNRIAEAIPAPARFLGLHFFSPAHVMKLLEVVVGDRTSPETVGCAFSIARRLGKIPVLSGVCEGFIGNRILSRYRQTAERLLLEGATPSRVDAAMRGFGMAMGPYAAQDMSGLDIAYANRKRVDRAEAPPASVLDRLVEEGRLGRKTGAGWYDYEGDRASASPIVEAHVERASADAGLERRTLEDGEIAERLLLAMTMEACAILDEGIAKRPSDVDLVLIHGYGFPRWRGGLLHHADAATPAVVAGRIRDMAAIDPSAWSVPPLLDRLASVGGTFESLNGAGTPDAR